MFNWRWKTWNIKYEFDYSVNGKKWRKNWLISLAWIPHKSTSALRPRRIMRTWKPHHPSCSKTPIFVLSQVQFFFYCYDIPISTPILLLFVVLEMVFSPLSDIFISIILFSYVRLSPLKPTPTKKNPKTQPIYATL